MRRFILMVAAVVLCVSTAIAQVRVERPYAVGADISWLQAQEDHGVVFSDGGVQGDAIEILRDNGFNYCASLSILARSLATHSVMAIVILSTHCRWHAV